MSIHPGKAKRGWRQRRRGEGGKGGGPANWLCAGDRAASVGGSAVPPPRGSAEAQGGKGESGYWPIFDDRILPEPLSCI